MKRTRFEARLEKTTALREAEESGAVCDSLAIRRGLMERVYSGEITILQAQEELRTIQRAGKRAGIPTRTQVYNKG
jgi:hypothetical protein